MHKILFCVAICAALSGCAAQYAREDDAKCQGYGAHVGDPAYVNCRAQLDAARTNAHALGQIEIPPLGH